MATDPEAQLASMSANLEAKTGKSIEQWTKIARDSGRQKHGELVNWLKTEHNLTHGYANLVAHTTLHPSTKTRFDVGLKLKSVAPAGRLEGAGSWNQMVTHRVRVESLKEVDEQLIAWLRDAYDQA